MRFILEDKAARKAEKRELREAREAAKCERRNARRNKAARQRFAGAVA